jgi:hypothetical protein
MTGALRSAEEVLLGNESDGELVICSIFEDQRPIKGVAGGLDWRLRGLISEFIKKGRIAGSRDELVYLPIRHQHGMRHLLVVGLGELHGHEGQPRDEAPLLERMARAAGRMNFRRVALSLSSFPFGDEQKIRRAFKGIEVEFTA